MGKIQGLRDKAIFGKQEQIMVKQDPEYLLTETTELRWQVEGLSCSISLALRSELHRPFADFG